MSAEPTKDFFISMLVRDISLTAAITDLIDNCVDGARRERPSSPAGAGQRFAGLFVAIIVGSDRFEIRDNCGGIPWTTARDYAFRFGRPEGADSTPNSIGQFGIGMKRALFKVGDEFEVSSSTVAESFILKVNVPDWRRTPDWSFSDVEHVRTGRASGEVGTTITVRALHDSVSAAFAFDRFASALGDEIAKAHQESMAQGLEIRLNGVPIGFRALQLLGSDDIPTAHAAATYEPSSADPVDVRFYAGLDESSPRDAGWYVYCNGRLVVGPDRSAITGWGEDSGRTIPQYHNQFARFRGYVFFDSSDAERLPWTTTKDGVDPDHVTFRAARTQMVALMRPVIDFLNRLDSEKDQPADTDFSLEAMLTHAERSPRIPLGLITVERKFTTPLRPPAPRPPESVSIQYRRPLALIDRAKATLGAASAKEVGERTFDYFVARELEDG
ncbi:ATP-binding protein [Cellulomonas sp.]|uniref:ATP-binding protein n=1 Tax=Cellulomonas sp. TaxID=40001 RepID=UPI003BAC01D8